MSKLSYKDLYPELYRQLSGRSSLFCQYPDRLNCNLCHKIMIEPIQTKCGCRFCLRCIGNYINRGDTVCPNCQDDDIEQDNLLEDKAVEREIMNLEMKCLNDGCVEVFALKYLCKHLEICEYRREQCAACDQWYPIIKRDKHISEECYKTVVKCVDCEEEMTREDLVNKHRDYENNPDNVCKTWIRDCPYRCNEEKLFIMLVHLRSCPNRPLECPFDEIGCRTKKSRASLKYHMDNDRVTHEVMMMTQLLDLRNENSKLKAEFSQKEDHLKEQIQQLQEINSKNTDTIQKLEESIVKMESVNKSLMSDLSIIRKQSPIIICKDMIIGDGYVIWTIHNIREKIDESQKSDNRQIVSETFYISRPGYHMSMKIYPSGDGRAVGKYLSIFFIINQGQYDNELSWPFKSKISLSILSNDRSHKDITVHMKPDNNHACYGRPMSQCNIGAGQPEFISLTDIVNNDLYLHNGALKVKLTIS